METAQGYCKRRSDQTCNLVAEVSNFRQNFPWRGPRQGRSRCNRRIRERGIWLLGGKIILGRVACLGL